MFNKTRTVARQVERELWARAAGRCQFSGCNKLLYRSSITQESVHTSEKAHIYSFSEKGPRGWGPLKLNLTRINDISNLMLVCHECHRTIDQYPGDERYPAKLLINWKSAHESRVETVTGIESNKKSHVVLYGANIGTEKSNIQLHECVKSMYPNWYPSAERPIRLSMNSELRDNSPDYWRAEKQNLIEAFQRKVISTIDEEECKHFSLFALAPQPLLILLGSLFTDKVSVETYQLHREPRSWKWQNNPDNFKFEIHCPVNLKGSPVLIFALSDYVASDRVECEINGDVSTWIVTIPKPNNDFLKSRRQLSTFRQVVRSLMIDIKKTHGAQTPLSIFPVMPIACAIELGRTRMPKADMPWILYDHDYKAQKFQQTFEIRGDDVDR